MTENTCDERLSVYRDVLANPKVPIALRVGIIGHRELTSAQQHYCESQIQQLLKQIATLLHNFVTQDNTEFTEEQRNSQCIARGLYDVSEQSTPILRLTSSLAAGADRLCMNQQATESVQDVIKVERAAIIPFSSAQYRQDFTDKTSVTSNTLTEVQEFDKLLAQIMEQSIPRLVELDGDYTDEHSRDAAYYHCAKVLIENCDLVIAIFDDSQPVQKNSGHIAGTHSSIQAALNAQKPVIQIDPNGYQNTQIRQSARFAGVNNTETASSNAIETLLKRIVLFTDIFQSADVPISSNECDRETAILQSAAELPVGVKHLQYAPDNIPDFDYSGPINASFSTLDKLLGAKAFNGFKQLFLNPRRVSQIKSEYPSPDITRTSDTVEVPAQYPDAFFSHFLFADALAVRYAAIHRSTFFLIYLLAALALLSAGVGAIFKDYPIVLFTSVGFKAIALTSIYLLYKQDAHHHHLWLQNRCLAEGIRPNIYLSMLGRCFSFLDKRSSEECMYREVLGHGHSGGQWVCMHADAVTRYVGFRHCPVSDAKYKKSAITFLQDKWLQGQTNYHADNGAKMKQLGETLSSWTHWLFYLTALFLVFKVVFIVLYTNGKVPVTSIWYYPSKFTTLATLLFPIIGTLLFAIRNHAEFDISAQRSLTMLAFFNSMREFFHRMQSDSSAKRRSAADLDTGLHKLSEISAKEVSDWLEIYEVKESEPG